MPKHGKKIRLAIGFLNVAFIIIVLPFERKIRSKVFSSSVSVAKAGFRY